MGYRRVTPPGPVRAGQEGSLPRFRGDGRSGKFLYPNLELISNLCLDNFIEQPGEIVLFLFELFLGNLDEGDRNVKALRSNDKYVGVVLSQRDER